jgi:hypothetical protein
MIWKTLASANNGVLRQTTDSSPPAAPALAAAFAEINGREADIREQFKAGKVSGGVWIVGFTKEREALNRPATPKPPRFSCSECLQEYRSAVARRLEVFTSRANVAMSREALRNVLVDRRLVLRPDLANARFEVTLTVSREEFLQEKQ